MHLLNSVSLLHVRLTISDDFVRERLLGLAGDDFLCFFGDFERLLALYLGVFGFGGSFLLFFNKACLHLSNLVSNH
jgi:hypothetical protein